VPLVLHLSALEWFDIKNYFLVLSIVVLLLCDPPTSRPHYALHSVFICFVPFWLVSEDQIVQRSSNSVYRFLMASMDTYWWHFTLSWSSVKVMSYRAWTWCAVSSASLPEHLWDPCFSVTRPTV